ncbi:flagellar export protein FliJ [Thermomonas alba]|uniref:flagellar export protein FliJ n=1 Tax=Thermomonas alba TaxID=2888525 RepID=UPI001F03EB4F|nr:flagellar export protein FliJ [Thermomonas alba]
MTRSRRLDPLLRVTQQRQDAVARELAAREKALHEQQQRLDLLKQYADSYAQAPAPTGATVAPAMLANHVAFRAKLDVALQQQAQAVEASRQSREIERARLLLASRDNKVLEQLAASYRREEQRIASQREQRELDDLGSRLARSAREENAP